MEEDRMMNANINMNNNCCSIKEHINESNNMSQDEMLQQIRCLKFAIVELGLYLDTHPYDRKALFLHNKYCKDLKNLEDSYQRLYGPLSIYFPCNKWRWVESPWPWEGGMK